MLLTPASSDPLTCPAHTQTSHAPPARFSHASHRNVDEAGGDRVHSRLMGEGHAAAREGVVQLRERAGARESAFEVAERFLHVAALEPELGSGGSSGHGLWKSVSVGGGG